MSGVRRKEVQCRFRIIRIVATAVAIVIAIISMVVVVVIIAVIVAVETLCYFEQTYVLTREPLKKC